MTNVREYCTKNWKIIILAIMLIILYFISFNTPYMSDDFPKSIRARGILGILDECIRGYMVYLGRFVTNLMNYWILAFETHIVWKLLQPLVIASYISGIIINCSKRKVRELLKIEFWKNNYNYLFFILFLIIMCDYNITLQGLHWITGSLNYLWPITLMLYFINPYTRNLRNIYIDYEEKFEYKFLVIGFFAGLSTEQVSTVSIGFALCGLFYGLIFLKRKLREMKVELYGFVGLFCGSIILFAAPGNAIRYKQYSEFANMEIYQKIIHNISPVYTGAVTFNFFTIALVLFCCYLYLINCNSITCKKNSKICLTGFVLVLLLGKLTYVDQVFLKFWESENFALNLFYLIYFLTYNAIVFYSIIYTAVISSYRSKSLYPFLIILAVACTIIVILLTPIQPRRVYFIENTLLYMFMIFLLKAANIKFNKKLVFAFSVATIVLWCGVLNGFIDANKIRKEREEIIANIDENTIEIVLPKHNERYVYLGNLSPNQDTWIVNVYKQYYNIDKDIIIKVK